VNRRTFLGTFVLFAALVGLGLGSIFAWPM
jgi:hypothetical protein